MPMKWQQRLAKRLSNLGVRSLIAAISIAALLTGCAQKSPLENLADAKSRMVWVENPNWRAIIKLERQVASILVIKGRVSEAQEIERRIASMAEVVFDECEE